MDLTVGPGPESDNRQFGELLARLRYRAGLSRADAAAKLGFSAEYLRLIEVGRRTPALGQMRNFLGAYGADGEVGGAMPGGDRPDLLVIDPLNDEPVVIEFKSRIREARRSTVGDRVDEVDSTKNLNQRKWVYDRLPASRAAELGAVVSLLAGADEGTLRKVREMLEDEVSSLSRATDPYRHGRSLR